MHLKSYLLIIPFILLGLFSSKLFAQDLIVNNNGDSLNVEILKISDDHIEYLMRSGKRIKKIKALKSEIKSFRYIFYSVDRKFEYVIDPNNIRFRLAISGGASWLLDGADESASEFFADYVREVNSGWHYKVDASYFLKNRFGIGLVFDQYRTSRSVGNVIFINQNTNETTIGALSDKIKISYLGPQLTYHIDAGFSNVTFFVGGGAGINFYKDEFERIDPLEAKGTAFGINASFGVDFIVDQNILLGFEISGNTGNLRNFSISGENGITERTGEDNDISRFSISVGLRFIK